MNDTNKPNVNPQGGGIPAPRQNPYAGTAANGAPAPQQPPFANPYNNASPPPQQKYYAPPYAGGAPIPRAAAPAAKRKSFALDKTDLIFAAVIGALTLFGVIAGLWGGFRLGFSAAFLLIFAAISIFIARKKQRPALFGALCGVLAVAMAPIFTLTANNAVRLFSVFGMAGLSVIWFASLAGRRIPDGDLGLVAAAGTPLLDAPGNLDRTVRGVFSGGERRKRISKMLLGVLCALPVLFAVVPLLMKSDAAFEGLLNSVFRDLFTVAAQIVVSVLLLPLILSFVFSLTKQNKQNASLKEGKGLDTAFIAAFLGALSVVYLIYLFSQLAYFFNAFQGLLPDGYDFSYAEYARRGFFELCAVAGINLALLLGAMLFSRKKAGRLPAAIQGLGTFLALFTLVLIGTAMAKMALYIKNYGMTVQRVNVSAVMVFMAAVFVAVLLRLYLRKVKILQVAAVTAAAVLLVLGYANVNGFVAEYNYNAYKSGELKEIDVEYLYNLGPEGVPYLAELMENEKETDTHRREATYYFYLACANDLYENEWIYDKYKNPENEWYTLDGYTFKEPLTHRSRRLSQFSLPLHNAYKAADAFLEQHPDFTEKEDYLRALYAAEWGYFDPQDQKPPVPAIWDEWSALDDWSEP